ncbi:hypothetical protein JCM10449v2_005017 [Rhodotorula kratochvilovae]
MAASYNSLPAELVKRIAEMVHDQDSRVPGYPLQRAPHPRRNRPVVDSEDDEDEDEESDPEDDTDVAAGLWSFWHGRGLRALVMVSRRVREAAVPLLYEVRPLSSSPHRPQLTYFVQRLAASALAHPFFQFHVLGEPLSQYVQHVVIDNVVPGVHRIPVACALRKLPNLKTLRLLEAAVTRYGTVQAAASIDIFNAGLTSALDVVERLELLGNPSPMETILLRVRNSSNIRSLMLYAASGRFPTSALAALMSAAQRFEGLTEIIIDGVVDEDATANWPTGLSFPALRSLHLSTLENIPAALHFAHVLAPNLERVKVRSIQPPSSPSLVAPHTIFRSLRTLSLDLVGIAPPLLHAFTASPLQHLAVQSRVYFSDSANWPISHNDIVSAPSTLRTVSFTSMFSLSTPVPADFAAACAARGVRLDVQGSSRSGPVDEFFERTTTLDGPRMAEVEEEQADAVEDTLAWAQRRARWLRAVDDGAGMQELAEATRRLRERQVMEAV